MVMSCGRPLQRMTTSCWRCGWRTTMSHDISLAAATSDGPRRLRQQGVGRRAAAGSCASGRGEKVREWRGGDLMVADWRDPLVMGLTEHKAFHPYPSNQTQKCNCCILQTKHGMEPSHP
uniref:Uncharacterized protein n=1 Tax=Setaria viridis TaxID=4556 RepID=A0A4U6SUT4_SETVI|nr:hypothetical protein SEVIR_9G171200v2 [Setaria viridis]